jgi:hypothetical protein
MSMTFEDLERIAVEVAHDEADVLEVTGVTRGAAGSDYAEVLMRVRSCEGPPCQMVVGAFRSGSESAVRSQLATEVRRHIDERRP